MNANDIQTLHDKYCAFTGIPVTDSKLFYIEYTGMGDLFQGAYNKGKKVKGLEFTYRHGDLWITTLYERRFEQRKYPKILSRPTAPSLFVHGTATLTLTILEVAHTYSFCLICEMEDIT